MVIEIIFLVLSMLLTLLFFVYGFNHYYLLYAARKYHLPAVIACPDARPRVSIHLPVYNEQYVIRRLVEACASAAKDYGSDLVTIAIIDDSDDETCLVVDEVVREYHERGFQVEALRRTGRQGFKAGALQMALERTEDEYIAVFDADFIPPADFLVRTLPYFAQNDRLGIIQCRWTHINRDYNFLTRTIAIGIDVHFLTEQAGRYAAGCFQNFNGSGGVLRKAAMQEAGGWQADTLAEDLDLSYRIQLRGYWLLYLKDVQVPGEVPPTVPSFKKQQGRWACGSLRTARKVLPSLLANPSLSFKQRLEAVIHLTGYLVHPLMFFSFALTILATFLDVDSFRVARVDKIIQYGKSLGTMQADPLFILRNLPWVLLGSMILLCTISAWISPVVSLKSQHFAIRRNLSSLLFLFLLGFGVSLSNTLEAGKALLTNREFTFRRTPKYAIQHARQGWRDKRYQVPLDFVALLELVFLCLGVGAIVEATLRSNFGVLLILIPYTTAYAFVLVFTLWESQPDRGG
jgi:cellulose synthase/poly-beta-1,6-N-acetylglucosamine synthase-like glycosyltransferase